MIVYKFIRNYLIFEKYNFAIIQVKYIFTVYLAKKVKL